MLLDYDNLGKVLKMIGDYICREFDYNYYNYDYNYLIITNETYEKMSDDLEEITRIVDTIFKVFNLDYEIRLEQLNNNIGEQMSIKIYNI